MRGRDNRGHGLIDGEQSGTGNGDVNHLVGMGLDVVDDEIDFCEEV